MRVYLALMMIPQTENQKSIEAKPVKKSEIRELLLFIAIAIVIVVPIRVFIAQPFIVKGHSMYPTFNDRDYLIVNELSLHLGNPSRGEVVIFKHPNPPHQYLIKRVIALPGETISIKHGKVTITNAENPKGYLLDEPYIREPFDTSITVTLGENEYFVMGDNRNQSSDSRVWGVLPRKNIIGTPLIRLFPPKTFELHPGSLADFK